MSKLKARPWQNHLSTLLFESEKELCTGIMFRRLTRSKRVVVGRMIALLYLFCVLAPSVALAVGVGPTRPCLDEFQTVSVQVHDHVTLGERAHGATSHHHVDSQHHTSGPSEGHAKHDHDGKSALGPCCAILCVSAMLADLPSMTPPIQPRATRVSDVCRTPRAEEPARLYRPPIA